MLNNGRILENKSSFCEFHEVSLNCISQVHLQYNLISKKKIHTEIPGNGSFQH